MTIYLKLFFSLPDDYFRSFRSFTRSDDQFNGFIKPFYANLCCYIMGCGISFVVYDLKQKKVDLNSSKMFMFTWNLVKYLLPCLISAGLFLGFIPITAHYRLAFALFAAFYKFAWGFAIGCVIVGLQHGLGGVWRDFMNAAAWKRLSKLNYCVLLIQVFVFELFLGQVSTVAPVQVSYPFLMVMMFLLVGITYAIAVIFFMLIELPASNLFNYYFGGVRVTAADGEKNTAMVKIQSQSQTTISIIKV